MNLRTFTVEQLSREHLAAWSQIQQSDPALASPCFRPEFVAAVAAVRRDVAVAVIDDGHEPLGFFPYQRGGWGTGRPIGWPMNDFQGLIARPGLGLSAEDLVRGCGLGAWRFDHLVAGQSIFSRHVRSETPSPYLDLRGGFAAYCQARYATGSREIGKIQRIARAAERQVGPVRFVLHADSEAVFDTLLDWKSRQYRRSGFTDIFARPWTVALLRALWPHRSEAFSGVLSALYLGDRLSAVHFGMQSHGVLHYWLPAYDVELARHSPGSICLIELARAAAAEGIERIDLGRGMDPYKERLMSAATMVAEGAIDCRRWAGRLDRIRRGVQRWIAAPVLGAPVRAAAEWTRPLRRWWSYR